MGFLKRKQVHFSCFSTAFVIAVSPMLRQHVAAQWERAHAEPHASSSVYASLSAPQVVSSAQTLHASDGESCSQLGAKVSAASLPHSYGGGEGAATSGCAVGGGGDGGERCEGDDAAWWCEVTALRMSGAGGGGEGNGTGGEVKIAIVDGALG